MEKVNRRIAKKEDKKELQAAAFYTADLEKATDPRLRKILKHNRKDELEDHAKSLEEYLKE